ncbi:MAG TPA: hypothetical protein VFR98_10695, partial [Agromyces sp.]|nr:hypothetical protein [Agromyces sp.]
MTIDELVRVPEDERENAGRPRRRMRKGWRIFHAIFWPLLALLIIGGGLAAWWLGTNALAVRDELEEARTAVDEFQSVAAERRFADLPPIAERLEASTSAAVEPTTNPIWAMGELVPGLGENFRAVRIIAEGVDEVSTEVVTPASTLLGTFTLARDPATGGFDVTPLREATEISANAERVVTALHDDIRSIDTDATIPQVADAVKQFDGMLTTAGESIPQLNGALSAVGELLGVNGPRNVVLAFLNNAEAAALGGGPAAQTLLTVDN